MTACQSCSSPDLEPVLSLGMLPACNAFHPIGSRVESEKFYPHDMLRCPKCELVQLGFIQPQTETFPASYPYTSSTTRALRENFADLATEANAIIGLKPEDLVIDIGGNDGNLLSNFVGKQRVLNVTPEDIGALGVERGIPHLQHYWGSTVAASVLNWHGKAKLITATNVFAHVPNPHEFVEAALSCLADDGVFLTESHYLRDLLKGVQFDTVYTEHARFLSLTAIRNLLKPHNLVIPFARGINSHGGSIRVYACRPDAAPGIVQKAAENKLRARMVTDDYIEPRDFTEFARRVAESKAQLWRLLSSIKEMGGRIFGIGAPSRAATLVNYVGIDHNVLDCIVETQGSHKLGHLMPGTKIEVCDEARLYEEQPEFACLLSWHIADELIPKIKARGYRGKFIVPLPMPRVVT
jgi:hypothetical protein